MSSEHTTISGLEYALTTRHGFTVTLKEKAARIALQPSLQLRALFFLETPEISDQLSSGFWRR
jgi:hypothetical protein